MKITTLSINGKTEDEIELPSVFLTPIRKDLIHKAYTNLNTNKFQRQGRHPTAGMDVVARSNDPPTGHGTARIARLRGGGGGRQGEAGGVASTRGGRQAHPPTSQKNIVKKINKKEKKLALCSAIAATCSKDLVESRGHIVEKIENFPIIVSDELENVSKAKDLEKVIDDLNLGDDVSRLTSRKNRTGKSLLRGRPKKVGKSVLFVTKNPKNLAKACGSFPGVEVSSASSLSVLDLAPGSDPIRLTVYSKSAIDELAKIQSPHLELMVTIK